MATLATQVVGVGGAVLTFASATASTGDKALTGKGRFLIVRNGSESSIDVTLTTPGTDRWGNAVADKVIAVAAGADRVIPLVDAYRASDGLATVVCSAVTSVTVAAVQVP